MDLKDLSLPGIYSSIEFTLERLQQQTIEVSINAAVGVVLISSISNILFFYKP